MRSGARRRSAFDGTHHSFGSRQNTTGSGEGQAVADLAPHFGHEATLPIAQHLASAAVLQDPCTRLDPRFVDRQGNPAHRQRSVGILYGGICKRCSSHGCIWSSPCAPQNCPLRRGRCCTPERLRSILDQPLHHAIARLIHLRYSGTALGPQRAALPECRTTRHAASSRAASSECGHARNRTSCSAVVGDQKRTDKTTKHKYDRKGFTHLSGCSLLGIE